MDDIEATADVPNISDELRLSVEPGDLDAPQRSLLQRRNPRSNSLISSLIVKDHFQLSHPSSTVKFVEKEAIMFVDNFGQFTIENTYGEHYITAKQVSTANSGLICTRLVYTLVSFLMAAVVFVFCIQIFFFLFLGLAIDSGLTSQKEINGYTVFGTLLSIPVFVRTLSQSMVLATSFVIDTWNGSTFMKSLRSRDSTLFDWTTLFVFLGSPILVGPITLFTGTEEWWTITSISWFCVVSTYFVFFYSAALYYNFQGCLALVRHHHTIHCASNEHDNNDNFATICWYALELRMTRILSGLEYFTFFIHNSGQHPDTFCSYSDMKSKESCQSSIGLFGRLTRQRFMSCLYDVISEPVRQHSVRDILQSVPFVTKSSWSLEYIYCLGRNGRFVAIIDGMSALTPGQVNSGIICLLSGMFLIIFTVVGMMVWYKLSFYFIITAIIVYIFVQYGAAKRVILLNKAYRNAMTLDDGKKRSINQLQNSYAFYQVQETFRITKPKLIFCWIILGIEIIFFYLFPLVALFIAGNDRVGIIFIIAGIITMPDIVFNTADTLSEIGSLEGLEVDESETRDLSEWRQKHRLSQTVVSLSKRRGFWLGVLLVFVAGFCLIFFSAVKLGSNNGDMIPMAFAPNKEFKYEGSKYLAYSSCTMAGSIKSPDSLFKSNLADFVFLAVIANLDDNATTKALNDWFVDIKTENLSTNVTDFKKTYQQEYGISAVAYKLFGFPDHPNKLHIISVRGTKNGWDALTDFQLWGSIIFTETIMDIMPLGFLWKPILPDFAKALAVIEDKTLKDVAYYKETTAFVKSLKEKAFNVQIVGHSLGGGIAMVTGAQAEIPAIGLSAPNNIFVRKTFEPQITVDALNKYTFNIVPEGDFVANIDKIAENSQRIKCTSPANRKISECHDEKRSLCEILESCGSEQRRPIPCFCVNDYGYDLPISVNGEKFSDYCPKDM